MMGRGHAISGAAVWLTGCAALQADGHPPRLTQVLLGTTVCAGWALAPDLDHPSSTVARCVGPATRLTARAVATFGAYIHAVTRTPADRVDLDGHRTVTHTAVWSVAVGLLVGLIGHYGGPWTAPALVFAATYLGLTAALPPRWRRRRIRTGFKARHLRRIRISTPVLAGLLLAWIAYRATPDGGWWLGLAVAVGSLTHCAGDCLTDSACPILWPLPLGPRSARRRWQPLGPPAVLRFHAGGLVERRLIQPLLLLAAAAALTWMAWPVLTEWLRQT